MRRPGRVLIVDDQEVWRDLLSETLVEDGFVVDCVDSKTAALEKISNGFYHLLVLDIRLDEADENNTEGIELLAELHQCGLAAGLKIMILSAYGTMDLLHEAFTRYNVADFAQKHKFLDITFLKQVNGLFESGMKINRSLEISWDSGSEPKDLVVNLLIEGTRIKRETPVQTLAAEELEDLLCRLFYKANQLIVNPLALGHSGAAVLWAQPFYPGGGGARPVVVKFGDRRSIDAEYLNFGEYVGPFIGGGRSTSIQNEGRTTRLGGIVYSFLGTDAERLESFGKFYEHASVDAITDVISRLFKDTCWPWYASKGITQPLNLTEDYQKLLGFTIEKLESDLANLKSVQGKEKIKFNSLSEDRSFTNPLIELRKQKFIKPTYVTTTHGDFNETNILVDDSGHAWLIDFGRTGKGHILRDVAELDSVVRLKLLGADDATLEERLKLEEALCGIHHFREIESLRSTFATDNSAVRKAFAVALHLRKIAQKLVPQQPNDDISEYYIALLYNALNTLRFYSVPAIQRQHGLLSASLLTDRLAQPSKLLRGAGPLTFS